METKTELEKIKTKLKLQLKGKLILNTPNLFGSYFFDKFFIL